MKPLLSIKWLKTRQVNRVFFGLSLASFFFPVISGLLLAATNENLPLAVPLWFSRPWGLDRLASPNLLWIIPTISFTILFTNFFLAWYLWPRERLLALMVLWITPIVGGLLFFTLGQIINVSI